MAALTEIVAKRISREIELNSAQAAREWDLASSVSFHQDWQGKESDPAQATEVRILWSKSAIYLKFVCHYRQIFVFDDCDPNGRRDHLWDRDVAEAFLQPEPSPEKYYKEFEVAPNGMWIDLDVTPGGLADLKSGLTRSVHIDVAQRIWVAEIAIPISSIAAKFDPNASWRANFYRVEGKFEPRQYLAWQPTYTAQPNFHVPQAFGVLKFSE